MTDTTTITDTTQEVTEATQQAVKQVNQITQYLQDSIPGQPFLINTLHFPIKPDM